MGFIVEIGPLVVVFVMLASVSADYEGELENLKAVHKRAGAPKSLAAQLGSLATRSHPVKANRQLPPENPAESDEQHLSDDFALDDDMAFIIQHFVNGLKDKMKNQIEEEPKKSEIEVENNNSEVVPPKKATKEIMLDEETNDPEEKRLNSMSVDELVNENVGYDPKAMEMIWDLVQAVEDSIEYNNKKHTLADILKGSGRTQDAPGHMAVEATYPETDGQPGSEVDQQGSVIVAPETDGQPGSEVDQQGSVVVAPETDGQPGSEFDQQGSVVLAPETDGQPGSEFDQQGSVVVAPETDGQPGSEVDQQGSVVVAQSSSAERTKPQSHHPSHPLWRVRGKAPPATGAAPGYGSKMTSRSPAQADQHQTNN